MKKSQLIIFDLDGTIANIDHRRHLVTNGAHDWDAFYLACFDDTPNDPVIDLLNILSPHHEIYIASGRSDVVATETLEWLRKYEVNFDMLWLREHKDSTPDQELKKIWLDEWRKDGKDIKMAFDDRSKVVKMWRDNGIPCFQVAEGDF